MTRDEYVESLKDSALTLATKLVMENLVARVSLLGMPFFNPITQLIVGGILKIAIRETEFGLFFLYVDVRVNIQASDFVRAALENSKAQNGGTYEQKQIAEQNLINSFRAFAKFTS